MNYENPMGRPRLYSEQDSAMDNYNARLTAWHARMARKIGNGNLSAGLRLAIEFAVQNELDLPPRKPS